MKLSREKKSRNEWKLFGIFKKILRGFLCTSLLVPMLAQSSEQTIRDPQEFKIIIKERLKHLQNGILDSSNILSFKIDIYEPILKFNREVKSHFPLFDLKTLLDETEKELFFKKLVPAFQSQKIELEFKELMQENLRKFNQGINQVNAENFKTEITQVILNFTRERIKINPSFDPANVLYPEDKIRFNQLATAYKAFKANEAAQIAQKRADSEARQTLEDGMIFYSSTQYLQLTEDYQKLFQNLFGLKKINPNFSQINKNGDNSFTLIDPTIEIDGQKLPIALVGYTNYWPSEGRASHLNAAARILGFTSYVSCTIDDGHTKTGVVIHGDYKTTSAKSKILKSITCINRSPEEVRSDLKKEASLRDYQAIVQDGPYCNVLYWPNGNAGFGHVSLEVFRDANQETPQFYLSYAMGNSPFHDKNVYKNEPTRIKLPPVSKENLDHFLVWSQEIDHGDPSDQNYGQSYNFLTHNCSHVVLIALKKLGYNPKLIGLVGLRPVDLKKAARQLRDKCEGESYLK